MAYDPNLDDEKQKNTGNTGQPSILGEGRQSAGPSRTNFVNTSEYLTKNPNEGENLVSKLETSLGGQRDEAMSDIDSAYSSFNDQVQGGSKQYDDSLVSGALSNPESFVQDQDNVARFTALRDASYGGPNSFQETDVFAPAASKVASLKSTGESLNTEAGRNAVLSPLSERPSAGKTALNQLMLQGTPDAAQRLQNVAGTFSTVDDKWNQYMQQAPSQIDAAKAATDAARTQTRDQLGQTTDAFKQGLQGKVASATNERDAFNSELQAILNAITNEQGTTLTGPQLEKIGAADAYPYITKLNQFNQGLNYYNQPVPLSSYTMGGSPNSNIPELGTVASDADYARESALQQLAGMDLGLPDQRTGTYTPNGSLPSLDYLGAFNTAGSKLQNLDAAWKPVDGGVSDASQLYAVHGRQNTPGYYTDPAVDAKPWTPPTYDPGQPTDPQAPYPTPTSPQPHDGMFWDPWNGGWHDYGMV